MRLATAQRSDGTVIWGPVVDGRIGDVSARWMSPTELATAAVDAGGRDAIVEAARSAVG